MKKIIIAVATTLFLFSCSNKFNQAMRSADKKFILETANEYFAQKKWDKALSLYERTENLVAGTDDAPNVIFNAAYANYYDRNYRLAGSRFKNFAVFYPNDTRREEVAYMSALCYYEGSQEYNLDPVNTELAINELQEFINNYPNSERSKNINQLIEELSYRLEYKAYENARQYYKMGQYKAANIAFENVLNDYPATKLRPKIYEHILKSRYELAINSKYELKAERIENALSYAKFLERENINIELVKLSNNLINNLLGEKKKFDKLQSEIEKNKAQFLEKQREYEKAEKERSTKKEK